MDQILTSYWVITVVIMGLVVNLAASYLKRPLDDFLGKYSTAKKKKNEKESNFKKQEISKLEVSDIYRNLYRVKIRRFKFLSVVFFLYTIVNFLLTRVAFELYLQMESVSNIFRQSAGTLRIQYSELGILDILTITVLFFIVLITTACFFIALYLSKRAVALEAGLITVIDKMYESELDESELNLPKPPITNITLRRKR
jgi:hypothetical protein